MRMYMIDPTKMCLQHLLDEHRSCHLFASIMKDHKSISGYISSNAIEPMSIKARHDVLVKEIVSRGYEHMSELTQPEIGYLQPNEANFKINAQASEADLLKNCDNCKNQANGNVAVAKTEHLTNNELMSKLKSLYKRV